MMSIMHLSGNHDAAIGQQILDGMEAQVESKVKPCSLVDDLARTAVVTATDLRHSLGCPAMSEGASRKRWCNTGHYDIEQGLSAEEGPLKSQFSARGTHGYLFLITT